MLINYQTKIRTQGCQGFSEFTICNSTDHHHHQPLPLNPS